MRASLGFRALIISVAVLGAQLTVMTPASSADVGQAVSSGGSEILLSGSLTNRSYRLTNQAAANALITARAWPRHDALIHLKPGDSIDLPVVSTGTLDSQGNFTLKAPAQQSLAPYTNRDGSIDLDLEIQVNSGTVTIPVSTKVRGLGEADPLGKQLDADQSLAARSSSADINGSVNAAVTTPGIVQQTGSGTVQFDLNAVIAAGQGGCYPGIDIGLHSLVSTKPSWTIVGQSFSNTPKVDAKFTYTVGQSSRLGITGTGSDGNWHANIGHTSVTTTSSTTGFGTVEGAANRYYKVKFDVQKWSIACQRNPDPTSKFYIYRMKPVDFYGGAWTQGASGPVHAHNCVWYGKTNSLTVNKSTAINWTNGLSLSAFGLSIGASSRTGYSNKAKIFYKAARGGVYLCGNNGGPASTTTYVVDAAKTSAGY